MLICKLCVYVSITCFYLVQDETGHSPVMCNRLCGPEDCLQCDLAMWAYGAMHCMDAEHTVPTVQVPLVKGLSG